MSKLNHLVYNKIAQNIFVWLCFAFLYFVMLHDGEGDLGEAILGFVFFAIAIYINNLLILPYFKTKRNLFFFLFFLNIGVFATTTMFLVLDEPTVGRCFNFYGTFLMIIVFGISLKMSRDGYIRKEQENEAELKLLKAQLNPHFLFNTLNNLYGLSVMKSDKLPDLMLQLSDLLRYSLYETKEVFVSLEKEISYLENYISLERIRLELQTEINFSITGNVIGKQIAPMLLIVFVENAFKHLGKGQDKKSSVTIAIDVTEKTLKFTCKNSYDFSKSIETNLEKGKSGIGLVNAKKRLALIYQDTHNLSIKKDNGFFLVDLKVIL